MQHPNSRWQADVWKCAPKHYLWPYSTLLLNLVRNSRLLLQTLALASSNSCFQSTCEPLCVKDGDFSFQDIFERQSKDDKSSQADDGSQSCTTHTAVDSTNDTSDMYDGHRYVMIWCVSESCNLDL